MFSVKNPIQSILICYSEIPIEHVASNHDFFEDKDIIAEAFF